MKPEARRAVAHTSGGANQFPKYTRSEEHTSELQSLRHLVCRLLLEKKNIVNGSLPSEPYPFVRQLRHDCHALRESLARAQEYALSLQHENQLLHASRAEAERYASSL